jgi:tellurite resistance protein TehA-like permease
MARLPTTRPGSTPWRTANLWGLGIWWLAIATMLLIRDLRRGSLPYGVGLWAFTFPLGAYTVATIQLARAWHTTTLEWAGAALFLSLLAFWLLVTTRTLHAIANGDAWQR